MRRINIHNATILIIIFSLCAVSGCGSKEKTFSQVEKENNYGYTIECDNILYYYHMYPERVDLYSYNTLSKKETFIDNVAHRDTSWCSLSPMYLIDGRIYYMRGTSSLQTIDLYSIDTKKCEPKYEGSLDNSAGYIERIDDGERSINYAEFEMFKYNGSIYLLVQHNIYKFDKKNTSIVKKNVNSLYINNDGIYYSTTKNSKNDYNQNASSGIFRYDINTGKSHEIIAENDIQKLNETELLQNTETDVTNIIADDENIYFIGTSDYADIFKYNEKADKSLSVLTPDLKERLTQKFRKYDGKIYYIDYGNQLRCVDLATGDVSTVTDCKYVYAYNIYNDSLYYYKITDDRGYPSELRIYDLNSGTDDLIKQF